MGHHKLRHDKECQNCGHTVEVDYCSKCGQLNTETRQSFHHLVTHMFEDITHYDGNFWKTIRYLLFRPGKLTIEYLMGHRMRYVPPVKLYIFISFVCFFIMALMAPDAEEEAEASHSKKVVEAKLNEKTAEEIKKDTIMVGNITVKNIRQLDSIQDALPKGKKLPLWDYYNKKLDIKTNSMELTARDIIISLAHTIPKVLFIYMPLFAFWLWLFHGKKRWYFFDHGIFTLHYFSFLLLLTTINMILNWLGSLSDNSILSFIFGVVTSIVGVTTLIYPFFYFFRAHSKFYGERKAISRIKSLALFFINAILIIVMTIGTGAYILLNMH